jgi:hypothetical protein
VCLQASGIGNKQRSCTVKRKSRGSREGIGDLSRKLLDLETELQEIKEVEKHNIKTNKKELPRVVKFKGSESKTETAKKELPESKSSLAFSDLNKMDGKSEKFFNCSKCKYKSKKETLLKKHMVENHEEHQCKTCEMKLPSSIGLLQHIAKHHIDVPDIKGGIGDHNVEEVEKEKAKDIESILDCDDSILDEFIRS